MSGRHQNKCQHQAQGISGLLEGLPNNTNNFIDTNSDKINQDLFTMTGNQVPDYHNDSGSAIGNGRCGRQGANIATVEDGDADDLVRFS